MGIKAQTLWGARTSWHEDQGGPQKARRPPNIGGDCGAKDWPFGRATSLPSDLCQEGDLHAERGKKIQLPRMERPACVEESGAAKRRAMKEEAEAESEALLRTHSSDDDDRDIDVTGE